MPVTGPSLRSDGPSIGPVLWTNLRISPWVASSSCLPAAGNSGDEPTLELKCELPR